MSFKYKTSINDRTYEGQTPEWLNLLTAATVSVGAGVGIAMLVGCTSPQEVKAIAESNLAGAAPAIGLRAGSCVGSDSDANGYVSCSATDKQGVVQTLECSTQAGVGCKPYQPKAIDD